MQKNNNAAKTTVCLSRKLQFRLEMKQIRNAFFQPVSLSNIEEIRKESN